MMYIIKLDAQKLYDVSYAMSKAVTYDIGSRKVILCKLMRSKYFLNLDRWILLCQEQKFTYLISRSISRR